MRAEDEACGDLGIGVALGDEGEDFGLGRFVCVEAQLVIMDK